MPEQMTIDASPLEVLNSEEAYRNATALHDAGKYADAEALLREAIARDPGNVSLRNARGVMFAAMGAHYFIRDSEREYDMAKSKDKDFVVIEGAVHQFTPCTACETTPGQYSNSVRNLFDYIRDWTNKRF